MAKKKEEWVPCRCLRPGQVRLRNGHIRMCWGREERIFLKKPIPPHMEEMTEQNEKARKEDGGLDFEYATEEQLMNSEFDLNDVIKFIQDRYDPDFDLHVDVGKEKIIGSLIDNRILDLG